MQLSLAHSDALHVLRSTKPVVEQAKLVTIHEEKINTVAHAIEAKLQAGFPARSATSGLGLHQEIQLASLQDTVNCCFWAEKGEPKWEIEWPKGVMTGGGIALEKCFQRALAEDVPILDAHYVATITLDQVKSLFRGTTSTEIPLLKARWHNLQQAGHVLQQKYQGQFHNVIKAAHHDAVAIIDLLRQDFPSFRDVATWHGQEVVFLKRAQLCVKDIAMLEASYPDFHITNTDQLTAFADYKIPQILREYGLISYSEELAETIDTYTLIPAGSAEEIEIRAATIWCIELIRQQLEKYEAADIDYAVWLMSQGITDARPYHRTYSIYY